MSKVDIKDRLDYFIYSIYNGFSKIQFYLSKYKRIVSANKRFKNIHENERCFILGTGPSLKDIDPKQLQNEILFGVNHLHKGDFLNYITPKYYCLYDQDFHTIDIKETEKMIDMFPETIFFLRTKAYNSINRSINNANNNIYYQHCNLFQFDDYLECDIEKSITAPYNVLLGCIQTAIYMGFSKIYLLGSDFNSFATPKVEHYYDEESASERNMTLGFELKYYSMVAYHHYALQKYAESRGIRIINLTINSLLDAYPKESFSDVINEIK